jgi:hypothetical protein
VVCLAPRALRNCAPSAPWGASVRPLNFTVRQHGEERRASRVLFGYVDAQPWRNVMTTSLILRVVYALCLLAGAWTHLRILVAHGLLWDYGGVPAFTRVFWTSLTFLDPLAVILLFLKPRTGLAVTAVIIAVDVTHNAWFYTHVGLPLRGYLNWMFVSQVAFLTLVVLTIRIAWRGLLHPPRLGDPHAV